ncbi:hypothetical protein ACQY74_006858 (plasmid) [Rhizobium leguminosarum bv. trifolii]
MGTGVGHVAPDRCRRVRDRQRSRWAVVSDDALALANHISSRCAADLIGPRPARGHSSGRVWVSVAFLLVMAFSFKHYTTNAYDNLYPLLAVLRGAQRLPFSFLSTRALIRSLPIAIKRAPNDVK